MGKVLTRVLLVSWEYPPVIEGGLGRHVAQLSAALAASGHEVHVLTRGEVASEIVGDVQVHRVSLPAFTQDIAAFMAWVADLNDLLFARGEAVLETGYFDLVHSHDWMVAGAAQRLAELAHAPWLVTIHATEFGRHRGWVYTHPQREIHLTERRMAREADQVICCSEYMAAHVRRAFGVAAERVRAIPNGVEPVDLEPASGRDLATLRRRYAGDGEVLVLMVGRLAHEKGFHVALDALAQLAETRGDVRWAMAGTGTAGIDLRAHAARLGLDGSGRFLGRVEDDVLHRLYQVADVVVVPSLWEPAGIVPLEAMARGCPVVVSDTGGLREVTAGCVGAVRVPPGDTEALSRALARLCADDDRRALMGRPARLHAARFDWSEIAAQTADAYAGLVGTIEPAGV